MTTDWSKIARGDPEKTLMQEQPEKDLAEMVARLALEPALQAATTLTQYDKGPIGNLDLEALVKALSDQTAQVNSGDMSRAETMLTAQAHTLDVIFNKLAQRAINAEFPNQLESFLKLALRAQSQSRATWETLSTIKNPPVAGYIKQANIAQGHQQVNNGAVPMTAPSRARENTKPQNELLERTNGKRLDASTACATSRPDPQMATVGEVHRPDVAEG
jgi:hypothetical protein